MPGTGIRAGNSCPPRAGRDDSGNFRLGCREVTGCVSLAYRVVRDCFPDGHADTEG